jgi:hypothetical protein
MDKEELDKIINRIKEHRDYYNQNEMAVRNQIINPILRVFGWDPENPNEVKHNYSTEEGVPDYSLYKNGKKYLFIEVKKLSIDIEQKEVMRQLAKYCFSEGINYGVLSNGALWILFRAFQEGTKFADRIIWRVDVENDDLSASIRKLNTVSKQNIEDIEKIIKKNHILDEIWQALLDEPGEIIIGLVPVFIKLIKEAYREFDFESPEIEDFLKERIGELIQPSIETSNDELPQNMQIIDTYQLNSIIIGGTKYSIKNAYEVLIRAAEWLISNGKLKRNDCPIKIGRKRYLINYEPKHVHRDFLNPKKLSNGLYIDCNISKATAITNARDLLKRFGYQGDILKVL